MIYFLKQGVIEGFTLYSVICCIHCLSNYDVRETLRGKKLRQQTTLSARPRFIFFTLALYDI